MACGYLIRLKLIERWKNATDVIISHFHGDHIPLYNANPFQLHVNHIKGLNENVRIYSKSFNNMSRLEYDRASKLSSELNTCIIPAEGYRDDVIEISKPVPHGFNTKEPVLITKISDGGITFVHAPDIQFYNNNVIDLIISWKPDIVIAGGPHYIDYHILVCLGI